MDIEEDEARRRYGWSGLDLLLEGRELDTHVEIKLLGVPAVQMPEWQRVNVRAVRVERGGVGKFLHILPKDLHDISVCG